MSEKHIESAKQLCQLMDDENDENLTLIDENGEAVEMEQIAVITYNDELYAILRPLDEDEDAAVVFKIEAEDEESLILITDDKLASEVIAVYNKELE